MKSVDRGVLPHSYCFYHTPPEANQNLMYYFTWIGHYFCTDEYEFKRKNYPHPLVFYIKKGVLNIDFRGEHKKAKAGDVVLIETLEPHRYYADDGLEFLYIHFGGVNSHEMCSYIIEQHGWLISRESNHRVERLIDSTLDFIRHEGFESPFQTSMRIYQLFDILLAPTDSEKQEQTPIDDTIHYIRTHVGESITLEQLADIAALSPYYFSHRFKRQTGFSPMDYVINTRIEKAKVMLLRTNTPIADIADEVGYGSSSSLINLFVKRVGISPAQYRKNHQGKDG
ncbi:MAG: AraC family transcriptional regulator [Lachnospiraceae bacterium]|nr:AraC family transcriptional regulator [Lachnospiraceae bacterium]